MRANADLSPDLHQSQPDAAIQARVIEAFRSEIPRIVEVVHFPGYQLDHNVVTFPVTLDRGISTWLAHWNRSTNRFTSLADAPYPWPRRSFPVPPDLQPAVTVKLQRQAGTQRALPVDDEALEALEVHLARLIHDDGCQQARYTFEVPEHGLVVELEAGRWSPASYAGHVNQRAWPEKATTLVRRA